MFGWAPSDLLALDDRQLAFWWEIAEEVARARERAAKPR
jgi:hypothetical protein